MSHESQEEGAEAGIETPLGKVYLRPGNRKANVWLLISLGFTVLAGLSAYGIAWADGRAEMRHKEMIASQQVSKEFRERSDREHSEMLQLMKETRTQMRVMNYILSLTPAEREKLNLMKPPELNEMQR